jgi:hypothetical protein
MVSITTLSLLVSTLATSPPAKYTLTKDYSGPGFFDQFNLFTGPDLTHGFVEFLDDESANAMALAHFVNTAAVNAAYMGVDSQNITLEGRSSIRISSNDTTTMPFSSLTLYTCRQLVVHGRVSGSLVIAVPDLTPERSKWLSR